MRGPLAQIPVVSEHTSHCKTKQAEMFSCFEQIWMYEYKGSDEDYLPL